MLASLFRNHLSYLPFSGSVLPQLADELEDYTMTKSARHCPVSEPLPKALVQKLIAAPRRSVWPIALAHSDKIGGRR